MSSFSGEDGAFSGVDFGRPDGWPLGIGGGCRGGRETGDPPTAPNTSSLSLSSSFFCRPVNTTAGQKV